MVAPVMLVVAGAMAGSSILNYVLNDVVADAQESQARYVEEYTKGAQAENSRYWADYYRNTGKLPRYPYRSGAQFNLSALYGSRIAQLSAEASRLRSTANLGTSGAFTLETLYGKKGGN